MGKALMVALLAELDRPGRPGQSPAAAYKAGGDQRQKRSPPELRQGGLDNTFKRYLHTGAYLQQPRQNGMQLVGISIRIRGGQD